ncbi:hypothetical protein BH23PLA1_BH23PLA1_02890 [soil metagenome]
MTLVGLDTMILIHAERRSQPTDAPERVDLRRRTLALLESLKSLDARVVVSTIALAEFLRGIDPEHRGPVTVKVSSRFIVKPVDIAVASFAADLWTKHRGLPDDDQMVRKVLQADVFVVAASRLAGARFFYSHDNKCRRLATQAGMEARDLPSHSEDLFLDAEIKQGQGESGLESE